MQIKNRLESFVKKNVFARKLARKIYFLYKNISYKILTKNLKVDEKLIIFASFNGKAYCDSPKAIYEYMLSSIEYKDFKFVWAFENIDKHKFLGNNRNTTVINIKSKDFLKALGKAKYWIFNATIESYIFPKKSQVFVQCWHGTPLKKLGCDITNSNNAMNSLPEIKKRYHLEASKFKFFLSPSKFATEKFISTWDLKKIEKENIIIEEGYPRNDFLINFSQKDLNQIKEKLNLSNINKKIILYAPTFRDNQYSTQIGYTYRAEIDFNKLKQELQNEYIILFRAHWLVAEKFNFEEYKDFIIDVSNYDDINELYVISDILITDYSSVFFDYANLKRPIIFYMYDLKDYRDNIRGFYLNLEDLPGNIIVNEDKLIEKIKYETHNFKYDEKYKKFNYLDDGNAAMRVTKKVIENGGKI